MNDKIETHYALAREVRRLVSDVYGATSPAVVLAPGSLAGLRLILFSLGVKRMTLSAGEYFDAASFPDRTVNLVGADDVEEHVLKRRPNAVVLSTVTWKGERLPLEAIFERLRRRMGPRAPILVADFAHAGAAGFPKVGMSGADIVVGDATKWITPPTWPDKVAWLWFRSPEHRALARRVFAPFYLALARPASKLEARWVDPDAVEKIVAFKRSAKPVRRALLSRYTKDLALSRRMAGWCGAGQPSSCMVWIKSEAGVAKIPKWAETLGLLWHPPAGGVRVMCRSDLAP